MIPDTPPDIPPGRRAETDADEHRRRAQQGTSLSWVHRFRVTPMTLVLFFVVVGVLWYVFETTDLFLRLFP